MSTAKSRAARKQKWPKGRWYLGNPDKPDTAAIGLWSEQFVIAEVLTGELEELFPGQPEATASLLLAAPDMYRALRNVYTEAGKGDDLHISAKTFALVVRALDAAHREILPRNPEKPVEPLHKPEPSR